MQYIWHFCKYTLALLTLISYDQSKDCSQIIRYVTQSKILEKRKWGHFLSMYSSVPNSSIGANRGIGLAIFKISYKHRADMFQIEA